MVTIRPAEALGCTEWPVAANNNTSTVICAKQPPSRCIDEGNLNQSGRLILCLGEMANTVCCTAVDPITEAHTSP
ncbi:hypothetical protein AVEN_195710-1, partial [Araneus ventricosus]